MKISSDKKTHCSPLKIEKRVAEMMKPCRRRNHFSDVFSTSFSSELIYDL